MDDEQPASVQADVDPWRFEATFPVRRYELDTNGHVNNAVYLNWMEQVAIDHVEALGYGVAWTEAAGGVWLVRSHQITYHRPAVHGDRVRVVTMPQSLSGVRGMRRTEIRRTSDDTLLVEGLTEWVWVRRADGRPTRIPAELLERWRT